MSRFSFGKHPLTYPISSGNDMTGTANNTYTCLRLVFLRRQHGCKIYLPRLCLLQPWHQKHQKPPHRLAPQTEAKRNSFLGVFFCVNLTTTNGEVFG